MEDAASLLSQIRDVIVPQGRSTGNAYDGVAELCLEHPEPKVDELRRLHAILKRRDAEAARVQRSWMLRSVRDSISSFGRPTDVRQNNWTWSFVSETGRSVGVILYVDNGLILGVSPLSG